MSRWNWDLVRFQGILDKMKMRLNALNGILKHYKMPSVQFLWALMSETLGVGPVAAG